MFASKRAMRAWVWNAAVLVVSAGGVRAAVPSPLYVRGYTVIPEPQRVELKGADFPFDDGWRLEPVEGVRADDVAMASLKEQLAERYGLNLAAAEKGKLSSW
jgi:hexosaminidase